MLLRLSINNIAVVKHADIEFAEGLNVITGETGAGKSVLVGAIQMILGEKVQRNIIRTGETKAEVSALFYPDEKVWDMLEQCGIEKTEDETLLIYREIQENGRGACRINGVLSQVGQLKEIGPMLVNIHGQQDTTLLYSNDKQLELLDKRADEKFVCEMKEYKDLFFRMKDISDKIKELTENVEKRKYETELLEFQIKEIEALNPQKNEDTQLEEKINRLKNHEKIANVLNKVNSLLSAGNISARDMLHSATGEMKTVADISSEYQDISERMSDLAYTLDDIASEVSSLLSGTSWDDGELDSLSDRLYALKTMCNKYKCSLDELAGFPKKAAERLEELYTSSDMLDGYNREFEQVKEQIETVADNLTVSRKETAKKFEKDLLNELYDLNMPKLKFEVFFEKTDKLSVVGKDKTEFMISVNAGESLKPMAKIASGGELSRIMLGIKSLTSHFDAEKTYIFDEIDTGISGITAQKVADKLKKVSSKNQTIVITHSSHIAAKADSHYLICKQMTDSETHTEISLLDREGRVMELARINAGADISEKAIAQAEEMLYNVDNSY